MPNRWWVYQRERFPLIAHGLLIAAFSSSAVSFSTLLRGQTTPPGPITFLVAFGTAFLFFLQLRIADEFKDFEEDSKYRPYRPVPRGLVKLRELALVGAAGAAIQLLLALWLEPSLIQLLAGVWLYLALMSKEFFVKRWLVERPVLYLISHMVIIPLVDLYATACDWWPLGARPPAGLLWFLIVSYFNGIVIEIGRKIRAPQDEEMGVNTYSALWGMRTAARVWLLAMSMTAAFAWMAAYQIDLAVPVGIVLVVLLLTASVVAGRLLSRPEAKWAKMIENVSGIWTLLMYLSLGTIPLLVRWLKAVN